jgi:hypothetical protein
MHQLIIGFLGLPSSPNVPRALTFSRLSKVGVGSVGVKGARHINVLG